MYGLERKCVDNLCDRDGRSRARVGSKKSEMRGKRCGHVSEGVSEVSE